MRASQRKPTSTAIPLLKTTRHCGVSASVRVPTIRHSNDFYHRTQLITPDFHGVVTPNNDTLYSSAWLDLRAEPVVLSVPEVPTPRYYSMQLVDIYTDNFAIFGVRTTGRSAGNYLIAGPYWSGDTPEGINAVVQSEGNYVLALGRTEVLQDTEEDLKKVRDIQAGYALTPLSKFLGQPSPAPQPEPVFPPFDENKLGTIDSFTYSNFLLQFVEVHPSEKELLNRFSTLGVGPGLTVDSTNVAVRKGVLKAVDFIDKCISETGRNGKNGWSVAVIPPPFGTREVLEQQPHWYLRRSVAASIGLYGQDPAEAFYPTARVDVHGAQLEGSQSQYSLPLSKDRFPPVQSFWSLTMYTIHPQRGLSLTPSIDTRLEIILMGCPMATMAH